MGSPHAKPNEEEKTLPLIVDLSMQGNSAPQIETILAQRAERGEPDVFTYRVKTIQQKLREMRKGTIPAHVTLTEEQKGYLAETPGKVRKPRKKTTAPPDSKHSEDSPSHGSDTPLDTDDTLHTTDSTPIDIDMTPSHTDDTPKAATRRNAQRATTTRSNMLSETTLLARIREMIDQIEIIERPATAKGRPSTLETKQIAMRFPVALIEELKGLGGKQSHHMEKALMLYLKAMKTG